MRSKSFFALVLLTYSSYLGAFGFGYGDCCDCCHDFNGYYAGIAGGIALPATKASFSTAAQTLTVQFPEILVNNSHPKIYNSEGWGEIFAGCGSQCYCHLYWGGRIGVNFSRFEPKVTIKFNDLDPADEGSAFLTDTIRSKLGVAEFTFDFKTGWIFCSRTLLFGILGGAVTRHELHASSEINKLAGITPASFNEIHLNKRRTTWGLRLGFGLEYILSSCWSLQVNYVYTRYRAVHAERLVNFVAAGIPLTHSVDFRSQPSRQITSVALAYYF